MTQQSGETGIPILTEIIQTPVYGVDAPERRAQPRPLAPAALPTPTPAPTPLAAADDINNHDRIAASVRTQVLQQLQNHADSILEQRIRDGLAASLDGVVAQLTAQLRQGLQQTLETLVGDLVSAALARELPDRPVSKN